MTAMERDLQEMTATVAEFLYHEAALLDEGDLEGWLELYDESAIYSIPQSANDHVHKVSIVYDDHRRLVERVIRLRSGFAYSQEPASTTVHLIGNVRIAGEHEAGLRVASSMLITEVRRGRQNLYAGLVEHVLRPEGDSFRILRKEIRLANCDLPLGNLTFLM
ncbi:aromatic-ring-hydroxylating dioxygenase subunit beta [Aeromicrobium sp. YIM 150415]|uniref:aromatic-ring-hydroxylating dioxygenase subunit beta n=1 Tax=Aeromicrobium sp. YIM 150415 TaxID=2803912 RepID=UPI001962C2E5|nr:aromatic-ring-hydroxylating dioxygenase subunit beta [Aeromicrobium sp. YIM 150415]MBM9464500.1 aromatic-ring-hydroxylating dioxygenase subunit beta [Aeromicrobium sp. YIM 150415]